MMTRQARPSAKIIGLDTHMILEAAPARPSEIPNGHQVINRTSHHYAEALQLVHADAVDLYGPSVRVHGYDLAGGTALMSPVADPTAVVDQHCRARTIPQPARGRRIGRADDPARKHSLAS
jgi:hypothetical protein